eukprot:165858-Lingulodinium_polyedra.AAC.1
MPESWVVSWDDLPLFPGKDGLVAAEDPKDRAQDGQEVHRFGRKARRGGGVVAGGDIVSGVR